MSAVKRVQEILTSTVGFVRPVPAVVVPITHPGGADAHARAAIVFVTAALVHFCRWNQKDVRTKACSEFCLWCPCSWGLEMHPLLLITQRQHGWRHFNQGCEVIKDGFQLMCCKWRVGVPNYWHPWTPATAASRQEQPRPLMHFTNTITL